MRLHFRMPVEEVSIPFRHFLQIREGGCLTYRFKLHAKCRLESFAWQTGVTRLPNPHLRNVLDVNSRQGSVQNPFVQETVHRSRKENNSCASPRRYLEVQSWKLRLTAIETVVQIYQHRDYPLTAIGSESNSIIIAQIKGVKVLLEKIQVVRSKMVATIRRRHCQGLHTKYSSFRRNCQTSGIACTSLQLTCRYC
jgi:hypothetical protein